jgi:hypothetical protein
MDLLQLNVAKSGVGYVAHENPSDFEDTLPLVRRPHRATTGVVNLVLRLAIVVKQKNGPTGVSISAMPQKWPLALTLKNN